MPTICTRKQLLDEAVVKESSCLKEKREAGIGLNLCEPANPTELVSQRSAGWSYRESEGSLRI